MSNETPPNYLELAANIVSAFVSNNSVSVADLPNLIGNVHTALRNSGQPAPQREEAKPTPAVPTKRSITPDYLISLEDGKHYKSLKRHLRRLGLTPEAYREKWGLPRDYPMVVRKLCGQAIRVGEKHWPWSAAFKSSPSEDRCQ